jgi:hypothetical protein
MTGRRAKLRNPAQDAHETDRVVPRDMRAARRDVSALKKPHDSRDRTPAAGQNLVGEKT